MNCSDSITSSIELIQSIQSDIIEAYNLLFDISENVKREREIHLLQLPYHINVVTERVDVDDEGVLEIYQKIVVANNAHKKIVVGRGGAQLKKIGTAARHDIQDQWGVNARLHLFVRVEANWEDMAENYTDQGLEFKK